MKSAVSNRSAISEKAADAAADLAAKKIHYKLLQEEEIHRAKLVQNQSSNWLLKLNMISSKTGSQKRG